MATNYPGSLDTSSEQPSPLSTTEMDDAGFEHDVVHTNHSGAIIALETKVGTGSSTAVADSVLAGTGAGTSAWTTGTLANDISGNAATATALETARTINGTSFNGTANITVTAAAGTLTGSTLASGVTASSLTSVGTLTSLTVSGSATSDSYRWGGTSYLTSTTTSALESELLARDVFDSSFSAFKTGWSYAGNGDLTDAGRLTELAGTSWLTWTDNSADNVLGNYTALVIAPNTGGSGGGVFVYNDQGSSYSPGWRELWNSSRTIVGPDGSASAPAYSFADDTNTGMYSDAANSISFSTAGTQRLDIDGGGIKGKVTFSAPFGSASAPGFSFDGDTNTGFYRGGSGLIYWSGDNNTGGYLWNNGIRTDAGSASLPAFAFSGDTNTGMYRVTTDQVGFATAGALRGRFWAQGLLMGAASTGNAQLGTGTGSPGAPVYHFYNDTNTGMYREETDMLGLSAGGEVVGLFRESTNNNTGSAGDGYVAFSTYMGGSTGTSAVIATTTISGQAVKRLMFNSSGDEAKDTPVPWEMSDESYKKIAVSSFHYNDMYVDDDGMHHHWDKASALKGEQEDEPPETWVPLKRHGFMWSQIMEHEDLWPLATDLGISDPAVAAATVSVVQRLIDRVAALEAA